MKILGLTGGVGMGKSTCAKFLLAREIAVVDTDVLARELVEPGQPALSEIQRLFGPEMTDAAGRLRRDILAKRVFRDSAARQQLESILHPRIRQLWRAQVESWRTEGRPLAFVAIPLLFETKAEQELDAVVCLACSSTAQIQRLRARGWPAEQIDQRIRAQWPAEDKIAKSDYVIWTDVPLEIHAAQLDRILTRL